MNISYSKKAKEYLSGATLSDELKNYVTEVIPQALTDFSYKTPESFLALPFDSAYQEQGRELLKQKTVKPLKYIFLVGMGGSSLGARALYDQWTVEWFSQTLAETPQIIFFDNLNENRLLSFYTWLTTIEKAEEVLLVVSTKSGTTVETLAMANILFENLSKHFGESTAKERTVVVTEENSPLWKESKEKGITCLFVPSTVSGRFSVFSHSNLAAFFLFGPSVADSEPSSARIISDTLKSLDLEVNTALAHACVMHTALLNGHIRYEHLMTSPGLTYAGKWCMQLVAESLGKRETDVPYPSLFINSSDMHSLLQLNFDGPKNFYTLFIGSEAGANLPIGQALTPMASPVQTPHEILKGDVDGLKNTYEDKGLPFASLTLDGLYSLGAFMQWKMAETMFLGKLMGVNPFNQPGVERYKNKLKLM